MTEEEKLKNRARVKAWRKANPEKVKAARKRYNAKHRLQQRAYRKKNAKRIRSNRRRYYLEHKDEIVAKVSAWRKANPDKDRAQRKRHRDKHKEDRKAYERAHLDRKRYRQRKYDNAKFDWNAPKQGTLASKKCKSTPSAVACRRYWWRKRLRKAGVPEDVIEAEITKIIKSRDNHRYYIRNWTKNILRAGNYLSTIKQEEQARFALALAGGYG